MRIRERRHTAKVCFAEDTVVTLSVPNASDMELEDRQALLAWAFAKACLGSELRQVLKWDLINGEVVFVIGGGAFDSQNPTGTILAKLEECRGDVEVEAAPRKIIDPRRST